MIDLRDHPAVVVPWLVNALSRFRAEHPTTALRHLALYCCPWSGWISLCLDSREQLDQNCPDFEFVEVALYDVREWAARYEEDETLTVIDPEGAKHFVDLEAEGDEAMNRVFFGFLRALLSAPTTLSAIATVQALPIRLGVQLLDSQYGCTWKSDQPALA